MSKVRFGIVGFGNIGQTHADNLLDGQVSDAALTGVVTKSERAIPESVGRYQDIAEMLAADSVDAVIIATPTMDHLQSGTAVLEAGLGLVMEKPIAMSLGDATRLVKNVPDQTTAAVMLNQRYDPAYQRIKTILASGELGSLTRFSWVMTSWYRPDVYFLVSSWRGAWLGEGGGALINQCIHNIDILQWPLGMPDSLIAEAKFGKYHDIEVEDEVTALLSYENGLSGVLVASTGEVPGRNFLEIVGDRASLNFDGVKIVVASSDQSIAEHCRTTKEMFGAPEVTHREEADLNRSTVNQHASVLSNVAATINGKEELKTPLSAGLESVELANAILLAAWQDTRINLPLDPEAYQVELHRRQRESALREPSDIDVQVDMDSSYR
ncbi:MAG: gfo/Idh/MocA family oxidoreductase [Pseudomonadales bacterium]|nr:gfo/Idh/MocA family oxidoreductase [Pseudomonadales bacterium]